MVGSLEWSAAAYKYIMIIVNYTISYPEAIPICSMTAKVIATKLMKVFMWVGDP